jgi:hypothetical protein
MSGWPGPNRTLRDLEIRIPIDIKHTCLQRLVLAMPAGYVVENIPELWVGAANAPEVDQPLEFFGFFCFQSS